MAVAEPMRNAALFLSLATATLLLDGCSQQAQQAGGAPPPPQVSVAEVISRDVTPWIETSGRLAAKESVQIRPRVSGVIEDVRYHEGDIVKQGDVLFVLDQRPFRAELQRAEADLSRARAEVDLARADIKRAKSLVERKLISPEEYDQRVAAKSRADANVRAAQAAVKLARLNLDYTEVHSPINGRAGRALMTRGNLVSSEPNPDLLTTVVSLDPMYVYFGSDELTYLHYAARARQVTATDRKGPPVYVGLSNEEGFPRQGYIDFIDNQLDQNTGAIRLRAVLDNSDHALTPGLFARVKILDPQSIHAMLVDEQAILTDQDRKFVYVLGPGNTAQRRNVKVGQTINGLRIINDGLQAGDRVIVYGIQKIFFPGMPVTPQTIGMGDPPPAPPMMAPPA